MLVTTNRLVEPLPAAIRKQWDPYFERVPLKPQQELFNREEPVQYVWFIEHGVCSQIIESAAGGSVAIMTIGREGAAGLPALLGGSSTAARVLSHVEGAALRIRAEDFLRHASADDPLLRNVERYAAVTLRCIMQIAACNRLHRTQQRLCRWLLMVHERLDSDSLPITHEGLALMVGARRASVTEVAQQLQQRGFIKYERGTLHYLDVSGLRSAACECYDIISGIKT